MITKNDQDKFRLYCQPELDLDVIVDWIAGHTKPEDVYDTGTLETWAEQNGWVLPE